MSPSNVPCKFYLRGHCKFRNKCRFYHVPTTCSSFLCSVPGCPHRHPRPCKYFTFTGSCNFGSNCSFSHPQSTPPPSDHTTHTTPSREDFALLRQKIGHLEAIITSLSKRIDEISLTQSQPQPSPPPPVPHPTFPCDHCDYLSTTSAGLKTHISKKHKKETLRENPMNVSDIHLSVVHRSDPEPSPSIPLDTILTPSNDTSCSECSGMFDNQNDLMDHINTNHASDRAPKELPFPNQDVPQLPCYDCENIFNNSHDLGNHLLQIHNLTFPCPHCGIILPQREELIHLHSDRCPPMECPGSPSCASVCLFDVVAEDGALF